MMPHRSDMDDNELELYRQQVEDEFFEAAAQGKNLTMYLYVPHFFLTEKVKARLEELLLEEAYYNIFVMETENWTVYDDGYVVTTLTDEEYRKVLFDKMITYFTEREEYEKCAIVQKEMNKL